MKNAQTAFFVLALVIGYSINSFSSDGTDDKEHLPNSTPNLVSNRVVESGQINFPNLIRADEISRHPDSPFFNGDSLWGLNLGGKPYVRQKVNGEIFFARLTVIGNISYFIVPSSQQRDGPRTKERILKTETGEIRDLNFQNLAWLCRDDKELYNQMKNLNYPGRKLHHYILIYNKRNPIDAEKHLQPLPSSEIIEHHQG